jgi:mevalonate kinase
MTAATTLPKSAARMTVTASAPGKVILFGEHAINRGQPALAAAVGLRAQCSVRPAERFIFRSGTREQTAARQSLLELARRVEGWRAANDFEAIRALAREDYFAPQKYILASVFGDALPGGLEIEWQSDVPPSSGLGSGGSAFTAMVAAVAELETQNSKPEITLAQRADWAHRGDIIAHGGVASALDTQTSLLGGVIRYTGKGLAEPVKCAPGLALVIAHTGVSAPTSEVNTRVRLWLAEQPDARMKYFQAIGDLCRAALPALERGDWPELGRLLTLNQLVLERLGVSCPGIARLIEAALNAGAFGAKLSGSGGGGIVIALVPPEKKQSSAAALAAAGGQVFTPAIGVAGARVEGQNSTRKAQAKLQ